MRLAHMTRRTRRQISTIVLLLLGLLILLAVLVPYFWIISNSLRPQIDLARHGLSYLPSRLTLENYVSLFKTTPMATYFLNSLANATACTGLSLLVGIPAGYALARFRFRFRDPFLLGILLSYMIPPILLLIPSIIIMKNLALLNTRWSVILMHSSYASPFAIWLLVGYFESLPRELEEAAFVDGCGPLEAMWRILLPLAIPGVVATGIFSFIVSWNEFLYAVMFLNSSKLYTLPVGLYNFLGNEGNIFWGQLTAAAMITSVPVAVIFLFFQKQLVQGLTAGAVKG